MLLKLNLRTYLIVLSLLVALAFFPRVSSAKRPDVVADVGSPLTILEVGDSIAATNQHRRRLQERLQANGVDFDFVGDNEFTAFGQAADINHQAFSGQRIGSFLNGRAINGVIERGLVDVLPIYQPDVILVLGGYNNLAQERVGQGLSASIDEYEELVDFVFARASEDVQVLFSNVTDFDPDGRFGHQRANVEEWNAWLANDVALRQSEGQEIYIVDNFSNVTLSDLGPDGLHLLESGQNIVGDNFFDALVSSGAIAVAVPEPSVLSLIYSLAILATIRRQKV